MSFRPFSSDIRLFGIAGMACLMCIGISRAGDAAPRSIEIVPFQDPSLATNFNSADTSEAVASRNFESLLPHAPHPISLPHGGGPAVLPPPGRQLSPAEMKHELELIDRRKNWVFMTPEELMGTESASDSSDTGIKADPDKQSTTAMQRYYQRLYDADHQSVTNDSSKFDPVSWTRATNSVLGGDSQPGVSPFDASSDPTIFQPVHAGAFSSLFSSDPDLAQPTPDEVRSREEQKTHMDDFKQMWDIDQSSTAAMAPISTPAPVTAPSPQFGSQQGFAPAKINGFSSSGSLAPPLVARPQPTVTSSRSVTPPHSDFAPPQRPF